MSTNGPPDRCQWSEDLLLVLSLTDTAIVLFTPGNQPAHVNPAAHALARRIHDTVPGLPDDPGTLLAGRIPADAWTAAAASGRWQGEVLLADPARPDRMLVLEVRLFVEPGGMGRRFASYWDVSARSAREAELERRHEELQRTYRRLAGTQEQLLQSEKMASIGQLAAGVAHEINNPIGYVHSNLGTLQDYLGALLELIEAYAEALPDEAAGANGEPLSALRQRLDIDFITGDVPQLLRESREGIERVTKIVQDLKDFSRIDRDEPMRPIDLEQCLESTLNIVWNDLKYKVRIEKYYGPLPPVECRRSEINQVLLNLLINAGQAIEGKGTLVLATGAEGGEAWISISDSGCGIAEDQLARIFDPFFTTKPIGRGTGLGLAICYSIVAKHHGRIEVSSRLGTGTTFRVVLPVSQPATGTAAAAGGAAQ